MADLSGMVDEAFQPLYEPETYSHKCFYGGRGTGKTHASGEGLVRRALLSPTRIVCGRQFQNSIKDSIKELIEQKIYHFQANYLFNITEREIKCVNGSSFAFVGLDRNIESLKSFEGADITQIEEANKVKQKAVDILIPTVLRKPNSEMWWNWNPDLETDPVDYLFRGPNVPSNSYVKHVTHENNPYFQDTELPQQMEDMKRGDPQKYNWIWLGDYNHNSDAQIFKNWRVGRLEIDESQEPLFGLDFGFSQDPNAFIKLYVLEKTKQIYICNEAFAKTVPNEHLPEFLDKVSEARGFPIIADSSRPETIDGLRRAGFNVRGAKKGPNSVMDGISWLQGYEIVISPDCPHMALEARRYRYKTDDLGNPLRIPRDDNNHGWDAVRYATEASRKGGGGVRRVRF